MTNIADDNVAKHSLTKLRRRRLVGLGVALTSILSLSALAAPKAKTTATATVPGTPIDREIAVKSVTFNNNGIKMAGNLYLPKGFTEGRKYAAIISVHPGGGVKEQTAGVYA